MVELNVMEYGEYKNLYPHEYKYIFNFYKIGDKESIALLITEQAEMTRGMRDFVADVIRGNAKRGRGEKSSFDRDYEIYQLIEEMRDKEDPKSLSREANGLFAIAAKKYKFATADVAAKAYYKMKDIKDEHDKIR